MVTPVLSSRGSSTSSISPPLLRFLPEAYGLLLSRGRTFRPGRRARSVQRVCAGGRQTRLAESGQAPGSAREARRRASTREGLRQHEDRYGAASLTVLTRVRAAAGERRAVSASLPQPPPRSEGPAGKPEPLRSPTVGPRPSSPGRGWARQRHAGEP